MKKRVALFILAALIITLLTACGGEKTYQNIAAQNNPYSMGTQSVLIEASSVNADEPSAKFKQSISPSDIELGQALEGKTVKSVTYNGEASITVVLDGTTRTAGGDGVYGTITVKQSGMASEGASSCTVNVRAPEIKVSSFVSNKKISDGVTTYNIVAKLSLPVGEFTDKAVESVTLSDGATGEVSVESTDGVLVVTVKGCNAAKPSVSISAEATTFEKGITVELSFGGSAKIQ